MKNQKGFSLIELLIVVIIIMIIAAIAIPSLLRARISANESATIGDARTVISASAAYASANASWFDTALTCLNGPSIVGCIPSYPTNGPSFLDSNVANLMGKSGYDRTYAPGDAVPAAKIPPQASPGSVTSFVYSATPQSVGRTGIRGFAGDSSGVLCASPTGVQPTTKGTIELDTTAADCMIFQ
jgi:type IV pilus assembly protein PilA